MAEDVIDRAFRAAQAGETERARELLGPILGRGSVSGHALMVLAHTFERDEKYPVAAYLYAEATRVDPGLETATTRLEACNGICEVRGLSEDFSDSGHRACARCGLRYRAEFSACPYCVEPVSGGDWAGDEAAVLPEWEDDTAGEKMRRAGRDVGDKIQSWVESEEVKRATRRVEEMSRSAVDAARTVGRSEPVKRARAAAREWSEHPRIKRFLERSEELGRGFAARIRKLATPPPVHDKPEPLHTDSGAREKVQSDDARAVESGIEDTEGGESPFSKEREDS